MSVWDLGDVVTTQVVVRDDTGTPADATTVTCTIDLPDGSLLTPPVLRTAVGTYDAGFTATIPGQHLVAWTATGSNSSAYTDVLTVSDVWPVVSLAEAKRHLNITSTTSDEEVRQFVRVATHAGERHTGRVFGRRVITDRLDGGNTLLQLSACPVVSITSVVEVDTTLTADDYLLSAEAGILVRLDANTATRWAPGLGVIVVTYTAGYTSQPPSDRHGVLEMLRHLWQTQRGTIRPHAMDDDWSPTDAFSIPRRVQELWDGQRLTGLA